MITLYRIREHEIESKEFERVTPLFAIDRLRDFNARFPEANEPR